MSTVAVRPGVMVGPHALERMRGGSTPQSRMASAGGMEKSNIGRFSLPEEVAAMAVVSSSAAGA
ncbi:hypothetical protein [Actinomadura rugatobispora]|uniref:FXSXX-COOH protein n=1 Tax=Actinomadura rugatobispora TaxID=1994 RepID=A0ABW0ZVB3_9ACTN|nr:hypothetical protein GCM10010200_001990 [Actinomadura rugatobispora]